MKRNRYISIALSLLLSGTLYTGCSSDYLDTRPSNAVSESLVGSSIDNLYMAINGIHRKMVSQDKAVQYMGGYPGFMICLDASADDMAWAQDQQFLAPHQWQIQSSADHPFVRVIWESYYEFILNANLVLHYVDNFSKSSPDLSRWVKGEALCFRAFSHFMLVQLYAQRYIAGQDNAQPGVPYRVDKEIKNLPRNTVEECYHLINQDLDEAIALLSGYKPASVSHFSPAVAYGLKARVALAQQSYSTAAQAALTAIELAEASGCKLMEGNELYNGFADIATKTKEAMWAALTLDDQTVNYYSFYALMTWNFNSEPVRTGVKQISQSLYDELPLTDLRRQWWDETGTLPLPTANYTAYPYSNRKFTARDVGNGVGQVAFMRLSELYITYCEASLRSRTNVASARDKFTIFMATRDPEFEAASTDDALLQQIMLNRRIELWGEGFRYYDLKRLNQPMHREGSNFNPGFCMVMDVAANDPRWQWAIPQKEMDANKEMVQNGY